VEIAGSNIVVTGASSGIGAALAVSLAARGATVGIVARRRDRLEEVLATCREHAPASRLWAVDLGDLDAAVRTVEEAWAAFGRVDVLVNNAAVPKRRSVTALTTDEIDDVMRIDFTSPVRMTMALLPRWLERDRGMVVNVSSLGGRLGIVHEAAYCAAKFALCGWSESMAMDLWDTGVDVRLINPGAIDTEIWDQPDNDDPFYHGPFDPPEVVADGIVAAIEGDRFEHYLPDMKAVVEFKTTDIDTFLDGAAGMARAQPEA
jgi:short-subunit dehydrogenase